MSLDTQHLDYFASLTVPPLLFVVSIADNSIWRKPLLNKENYLGPKGGYGVSFDRVKDKLTKNSSILLRLIAERSNGIIARYLLEEVSERLTEMDLIEEDGNFDITTADIWGSQLQSIDRAMRDAKCLLHYERRSSSEMVAVGFFSKKRKNGYYPEKIGLRNGISTIC